MILAVEFYVEVMRELMVALGAALLLANGYALIRRRKDKRNAQVHRAQRLRAKNAGVRVKEESTELTLAPIGRTVLYAVIGFVVMIWGAASLLVQG